MNKGVIFGIFFVFLLLVSIGSIIAPSFTESETISYLQEAQSPLFTYNFSTNVSEEGGDILPLLYTRVNFSSSLYPTQTSPGFYSWFSLNSSTGILTINSSNDNQTGRFNVSIRVSDNHNPPRENARNFYFIINATNDAPIFTSIANVSNFTVGNSNITYINASDEERQYPLLFNISFVSCTPADFSARNNCSLFNLNSVSNTSASISYTPSLEDVGVYYANISIMDAANLSSCNSSTFCSSDYFLNKTTYYSRLVTFNILPSFQVNYSDCSNKIFQQGVSGTCNITIYTKGQNNSLNISSAGFLRNYNVNVSNRSWFYPNVLVNSTNFLKTIIVNVTPNKTEIGNWTINLTVMDKTIGENATLSQIPIYVNRTFNSAPNMVAISSRSTSVTLLTNINVTVYDDDLLIPDKNVSFGGYNETLTFNVSVLNQSDNSQELTINSLALTVVSMPVSMSNKSIAIINFSASPSEAGNYTINVSVMDLEGLRDSKLFNLTISSNNAPKWNLTNVVNYFEGNNTYLNLSENVSDPDLDALTFSSIVSDFSSFSLNSTTGVINFTSVNEDVGSHFVTLTTTDTYGLYNNTYLTFVINNVNETPYLRPLEITNCTTISTSNYTCGEKNITRLVLWAEDDDFKILQKSFYDESLTLDLNITGRNPNLFTFDKDPSYPAVGSENRSRFNASFTPTKNDVGDYIIRLNISDNSGKSVSLQFNITVSVFEDNPVLMDLSNQTTGISRRLGYRINASDDENGFSNVTGNNNFTFSYSFLSGNDFINNNDSIFNTTTGELNYLFNTSQGGVYNLRIDVNDTTDRQDSQDFWINVYDFPNLTFPPENYEFAMVENISQNIIVNANHSVLNNLTYIIKIDTWNSTNSVIYNSSYFGNNSNLSFSFTPDFNNETSGLKNLTLIVYPSDSNLIDNSLYNLTRVWNLTINHTNFPLNLSNNISVSSGSSQQTAYLDNFFQDFDANDPYHNQTIGFVYNTLTGGCPMGVVVSNWTNGTRPSISFSATTTSSCNFSVTGFEYNESNTSEIINNLTSNNFSVDLTMSVQVVTTTISQSSTTTKLASMKVVTPGLVSVYPHQTMTLPITVENTGQQIMNSIKISSDVLKDGSPSDLIDVLLDKAFISSIPSGGKETLNLTFFVNTNYTGDYNIVINASSNSPKYTASGNIYFSIGRVNDSEVKKYILFAEEFLTQNKRCVELKEYIKTSYDYFNKGNFGDARLKAEQAVNACKNLLLAGSPEIELASPKKSFVIYFAGSILVAFVLGIGYYLIKRHRFKRGDAIKIYED